MADQEILDCLTEAVKNCNRNLYEWAVEDKKGGRSLSERDKGGLIKNWIARCLKNNSFYKDIKYQLNKANILFVIDNKRHYITGFKISLDKISLYEIKGIDKINELINRIDFDNIVHSITSSIDFSRIEKISF